MKGVFDAGLLLFHFGFGRGADIDDGHTASELGEALLELLAIVVAGGFLDLLADLVDAAGDRFGGAAAFNDDGVFLADVDALGLAEVAEFDRLELDAEVFGDHAATGEDGEVFEHGLAAIAKAWGFDGGDVEDAAQLVDHEGGEGFAFDIFGDDEERLAGLGDLLKQRKHVLERGDFLLVDEDVGALEQGFHALGVGHEVRAEVAFVELHAFHHIEGGFDAFRFLDGDRAVLADLVHRLGDDAADFLVGVCRDRGDLGDFLRIGNLLRKLLELGDDGLGGLHDAALKRNRVGTGGDIAEAFLVDCLGKYGSRSSSIARDVGGLAGNFTDELCAHVFIGALEFDFLGNRDTVLGDGRRSELLVEDHVATGRSECRLDGACEFFHAAEQSLAGGFVELQLFGHDCVMVKS